MAEGTSVGEQTILEKVDEQEELLRMLLLKIDNLVDRNPKPEAGKAEERNKEDNIFDEILNILNRCRGLIKEADEKIWFGISQKVQ